MPTTNTKRMEAIAEQLADIGLYTAAASVIALAAERDSLRSYLENAMPIVPTRVPNGDGAIVATRHMDALSPDVPEGYDTVLGYLAKNHPDVLDMIDWRDPSVTQRDGWWLSHLDKGIPRYARAPACFEYTEFVNVRVWPIALLAQRWS